MPSLTIGHTDLILDACKERGLSNEHVAYILATAYHETNKTMTPVEEGYYLGDKASAYQRKLRYYPWYGRGYVQLTWRENYQKVGDKIGVSLIEAPSKALDPVIGATILVRGMIEGWFTGVSLNTYTTKVGIFDPVKARKIINGTDKAAEIAQIYQEYLTELSSKPVELATNPSSFLSFLFNLFKR